MGGAGGRRLFSLTRAGLGWAGWKSERQRPLQAGMLSVTNGRQRVGECPDHVYL